MRINNIKKSLKNSLDYIISNSSKAIKTGVLVAATTILPVNYANGQKVDNKNIKTDTTNVQPAYRIVKSFHIVKPGEPYQFEWQRNDEYQNIKPTAKPMSNTGEFVAQFYNGYTATDNNVQLTSADSAAMKKMRESTHPKVNDDEWRMRNGRQNNVEQTEFLDKALNNESKNDPLLHLTKKESQKWGKIVNRGPTYSKYFIGINLQYDGETISEDGQNIAVPPINTPLIVFVDQNANIKYTNKIPVDDGKTHARTRLYVGAGLENIFDQNFDNTANINKPIFVYQGKLGLDFGRINVGAIGAYGKPTIVQTIVNKNTGGHGETNEEYIYKYNDIQQYGLEAGIKFTKRAGFTFNTKRNQSTRLASGTVDQITDDGQGNFGHVKQDLGTKNESKNYTTFGGGITYDFSDNISTTAEIDFNGKKPAAVSVNLVWTIGDKYK